MSDRVAEPASSLLTDTLSCSSARRTLACRTLTSWAAASALKNWLVVDRACWKRASISDASAAVCPALAARFSAPRRKPVKRSMLALSDVLTLRLVVPPLITWPVTGSTREGPSL